MQIWSYTVVFLLSFVMLLWTCFSITRLLIGISQGFLLPVMALICTSTGSVSVDQSNVDRWIDVQAEAFECKSVLYSDLGLGIILFSKKTKLSKLFSSSLLSILNVCTLLHRHNKMRRKYTIYASELHYICLMARLSLCILFPVNLWI